MYKPVVCLEAVTDIGNFYFNNTNRKFEYAKIIDINADTNAPKQMLSLFYSNNDIDYTKEPGLRFSEVSMSIESVIEMLNIAMTTVVSTHKLTEGCR